MIIVQTMSPVLARELCARWLADGRLAGLPSYAGLNLRPSPNPHRLRIRDLGIVRNVSCSDLHY